MSAYSLAVEIKRIIAKSSRNIVAGEPLAAWFGVPERKFKETEIGHMFAKKNALAGVL